MSAVHRKAARGAAEQLLGIAGSFPFASERDKSAWLAGLLTVCFRHRIEGPVPMFWIFGNVGTGKTLLADHTARTATGKEPIHLLLGAEWGLQRVDPKRRPVLIVVPHEDDQEDPRKVQACEERRQLADLYDRLQHVRGDARRALRI